jgi:hypothetical protein
VGFDASADEWLRKEVGDRYEEARVEMHGYYVLALLPPCDGFPLYSNHEMRSDLERYSFRAAFLQDVEEIIGPERMGKAYSYMTADELGAFGRDLLRCARDFANANHAEHAESADDVEYDEASAESRAHILFAAAKWCLFWAARGFGLEPDY